MAMHDATNQLSAFAEQLREDERSEGTIEKYMRDVRNFFCWLADKALEKVQVSAWRAQLLADDYAPETINSMIVALNRFLDFIGRSDCGCIRCASSAKLFRRQECELTRAEYERLVQTAERKGTGAPCAAARSHRRHGIRVSRGQISDRRSYPSQTCGNCAQR